MSIRIFITGGTGPLPSIKTTSFAAAGNYLNGTICVPKAKGSKTSPQLGSNPVWDIVASSSYTPLSNVLTDRFRVTP